MRDIENYDPEQAGINEIMTAQPSVATKAELPVDRDTLDNSETLPSSPEVTVLPIDPVALQKERDGEDAGDETFAMVEPDLANDEASDPAYL